MNYYLRYLKVTLILALLCIFSPTRLFAGWNEVYIQHMTINWNAAMECYDISIPYYCDDGNDDFLDFGYLYVKTDNTEYERIFEMRSQHQGTAPYFVKLQALNNNIVLVHSLDQSIKDKGYQYEMQRVPNTGLQQFWWANGYVNIMRLKWFPPTRFAGKNLHFRGECFVADADNKEFQAKDIDVRNTIDPVEPHISTGKWNGNGTYTYTLTKVDKTATHLRMYTLYADGENSFSNGVFRNNSNWQFDRCLGNQETGSSYFYKDMAFKGRGDVRNMSRTFNKTMTVTPSEMYYQVKGLDGKDRNTQKNLMLKPSFLRLLAVASSRHFNSFDNVPWGMCYPLEQPAKSAEFVRINPISPIFNQKIYQDNDKINLSWEIKKATDGKACETVGFILEKYNTANGKWESITGRTIPVKGAGENIETKYSYTYTLSDEEKQKGDVKYQFRVRRDVFSGIGGPFGNLFIENFGPNGVFVVNTNYRLVKFLSVGAKMDNQSKPTNVIQLKLAHDPNLGGKLWDDKNVKLKLRISPTIDGAPEEIMAGNLDNYTEILGASSCTKYHIEVDMLLFGRMHKTIATDFQMPDVGARKIKSLEVSKGYFNDCVEIRWSIEPEASDFDFYTIERQSLEDNELVSLAQLQHSGLAYRYKDENMNAGEIYRYIIKGYSKCTAEAVVGHELSDYGFSQPYATVSGRIAYKGNQGVRDVAVAVIGGGDDSKNVAIQFEQDKENVSAVLPKEAIDLSKKEMTMQMYMEMKSKAADKVYTIVDYPNNLIRVSVGNGTKNVLKLTYAGVTQETTVELPMQEWVQLTLASKFGQDNTATTDIYVNGEKKQTVKMTGVAYAQMTSTAAFQLGQQTDKKNPFVGYMDEIRFWNRVLQEKEVKANCSAFISGREKGLSAYYRCDEAGVQELFDLSAVKNKFNKRDGKLSSGVVHSTQSLPSADQLANKAYTDEDGNYLLNTVPYTSLGVQYNIMPILGIHKFNPNKRPIFVSPSATVFNDVNFTDESSFEVTGYVTYENTTYPVEGCHLYVDGEMCFMDGSPVMTDNNGKYTISVPIGDHFIEVRKPGHEFKNAGRFPADKNKAGLRHTFEAPMKGLDFEDQTKVVVAGRVAGGEIEYEKPLGLKQSKANIGQAVITMVPLKENCKMNVEKRTEGSVVTVVNGTKPLKYANVTPNVMSEASVGFGDADKVCEITVKTDPKTGEFAALMPPIQYMVRSVSIPKNAELKFDMDQIGTIDATEVELNTTDSVVTEGKDKKRVIETFTYNAAMKVKYMTDPTFKVYPNKEGAFGDSIQIYVDDNTGERDTIRVYTVAEDGTVTYNYGYPLYSKQGTYDIPIEAYELYVNKDAEEPVEDKVPMRNLIVDIANQFGIGQKVYVEGENIGKFVDDQIAENQVQLDSTGRATYRFAVGLPNINGDHTLGLSMSYDIDGRTYNWAGNGKFKAIVLGELVTGNNFVTSGPDELLLVLRDPPGSGSYSYMTKDHAVTWETNVSLSYTHNTTNSRTVSTGLDVTSIQGTPAFGLIQKLSVEHDAEMGASRNYEHSADGTYTCTMTTSETISTSDSPDYVGSAGDVFVGNATNLLFGKAKRVGFVKQGNEYQLDVFETITFGQEFETMFSYTQNYIENTLLPNLEANRNSLLKTVTEEEFNNYVNNGTRPVYITTYKEGDPQFGSSNNDKTIWGDEAKNSISGKSYKMVCPEGIPWIFISDDVQWHNMQIKLWKDELAANEKSKVVAIEKGLKGDKKVNHSFDAGTTIESSSTLTNSGSSTISTSYEYMVSLSSESGTSKDSKGVTISINRERGLRTDVSETVGGEDAKTYGYVLSDDGYNDAITVDVYDDGEQGYGPIFYTRGGQTSCPYEGADSTKYYETKTQIAAATMQIDKPQILIDKPTVVNVPSGEPAVFKVTLMNNSETQDDVWYDIAIDDTTNPDGAILSMDGAPINAIGRAILVPAGDPLTKTILLKQSDLGVLDYKDISIQLKSQCQGDPTGNVDPIYSEAKVTAQFVPTCSNITMELDKRVMNARSENTSVGITVKDYNTGFLNFEGFMIQMMREGDLNWTMLKKYVMNNEKGETDVEVIDPSKAKVIYNFDMKDNPDGRYKFRAITMCKFGSETINRESEIIEMVKDMNRPKLLGKPSPSNGILTSGGEISVVFNEDIKSNNLTRQNFTVRGKLNGYRVDHNTAMKMGGGANGAETEATIDLSNRSFTMEMWLRYETEGEIISHGSATTKLTASTDAVGHLIVDIAGEKYTSEKVMPKNKWIYLSLIYDNEAKTLSAYAAEDANTINLFTGKAVPAYNGNGKLVVGRNMTGAMHGLTLWNRVRPMKEIQGGMYTAKHQGEQNLTGYWKMEEGHGSVAIDEIRGRHLNLDANNWYIAGKNIAMDLDGETSHIGMNITTAAPTAEEDFMLELWFKVEAGQSGTGYILDNGREFGVRMNNGILEFAGKESSFALGSKVYADGNWHHLAINVLRKGNAAFYADGEIVKQTPAVNVGTLASEKLVLGAERFHPEGQPNTWELRNRLKMAVDEVRLWNASVSADFIRNNRFNRMEGTESGLAAYYPFEKVIIGDGSQPVTVADYADHSKNALGEAEHAGVAESAITPSLKDVEKLADAAFDFVASERKVVINLNEAADIIEGTTLEFTLSEVRDMNDNLGQEIKWSAYVQRNMLKWDEEEKAIVKEKGAAKEFTATIINKGSEYENWALVNLPYWLTCDMESGSIAPQSREQIKFEIAESMPVGTYEETIYLVGNNEIYEPMTVSVSVTGDAPTWSVNPSGFESSMAVFGQLKINGKFSENENDQVAAFIGKECVGIGHPEYNARYDAYFVTMVIYSNQNQHGKLVKFKAWEANTGNVYPVVEASKEVTAQSDVLIGSTTDPVIWNTVDKLEQTIDLKNGWTWTSTYITPDDNSVGSVMKELAGTIEQVKSKEQFAGSQDGTWEGSLKKIEVGNMYKIKTSAAALLNIVGRKADPAQSPITIKPAWNWIGCNTSFVMSLQDAFADLNPQNGDYIKSHTAFAFYDNYEWIGSLKTIEPGNGYVYKSAAREARTFRYPSAPSVRMGAPMRMVQKKTPSFDVVENNKYSGNMTMVAIVMNGYDVVHGTEVGVFAGNECRGAAVAEENGKVYVTIAGNNNESDVLTIKVKVNGEIITLKETICYVEDNIVGTIAEPFIIQMKKTPVDVDGSEMNGMLITVKDGAIILYGVTEEYSVFDAAGKQVYSGTDEKLYLPKGVYMIKSGDMMQKVVI